MPDHRSDESFGKLARAILVLWTILFITTTNSSTSSSSSSSPLSEALLRLKFRSSGVSTNTDVYEYKSLPCLYLEPENVTKAPYAWAITGHCPYLYLKSKENLVPPPLGVRSSVPVGGIAAGSVELRGTGALHEWTIMNQSPGGAAKFSRINNAFFGVRIEDKTTNRVVSSPLRTTPVGDSDTLPTLSKLKYSGAYPVSRLDVADNTFPVNLVSLFAYSTYSVGDMEASAVPAAAFTLVVNNSLTHAIRTSFLFVLPYGVEPDSQRASASREDIISESQVGSAEECFADCQATANCQSWTYDVPSTICSLQTNIPLNTYKFQSASGLKGSWNSVGNCLSYQTRSGTSPTSGSLSLCGNSTNLTWTTANSVSSVWKQFVEKGELPNTSDASNPHGAVALSINLEPGQMESLTIVLSWYFPNRDYNGQILGNYYTNLFSGSEDAANHVLTHKLDIVHNISLLHDSFFNSSLPDWMSDVLVNSLSHIRSAMWLKDGRWRQWEAYDCVNIDSVHNDGERHIPYIMFFPESTVNKMRAWASRQLSNGMIQEQLSCGCTDAIDPQFDHGCGRIMSDCSSMFAVYLLELYQWYGDKSLLQELWPAAKRAIQWHLSVSKTFGIPYRLQNTYDILGLDGYNVSTYNSVFHLLALQAGIQLASIVGDSQFEMLCFDNLQLARKKLDELLWNTTGLFYNAYWGLPPDSNSKDVPGAIMTDSLYAQVLAYTLGLGTLVSSNDRVLNHLKAEYARNRTPFGMLVMTGRYPYPGGWQDNAVWQMGNPNWASLNLQLAPHPLPPAERTAILDVAKVTMDRWRTEVNDLWNVAGITGGIGYGADGESFITSHYGFYMSSWHLIFALSGQQADVTLGTLSFRPHFTPPYSLPLMLPGVLGLVSQNNPTSFTVQLQFGNLQLSILSIGSISCRNVTLTPGTPFSCPPS